MTTTITPFFKAQQLTSARLAAAANLAGTYTNGTQGNGARLVNSGALAALSVDGVAVAADDRILLPAQTNANENGLYVVINAGSSAVAWILERAQDFHSIEQIKAGYFCPIEAGNTNAGDMFVVVEPLPAVLGVSNLNFTAAAVSGLGTMSTQNANAVAITGGTISGITALTVANTALHILDTNASHDLVIVPGSDLTADRNFTITTGDAARTLDISAADVTVTTFGASLVDDATAAAARTTLGAQAAANIIAATTADIGGGGAGPISVVVAGLTAASVVVATIESSTNTVAVAKCTATATGFDITFDGDPGAACLVNYVAFIAAQ